VALQVPFPVDDRLFLDDDSAKEADDEASFELEEGRLLPPPPIFFISCLKDFMTLSLLNVCLTKII
jgi:hypothetical protein